MKIANDVQHVILTRLWQKMGHTVSTFKQGEEYDVIILHNLDSLSSVLKSCGKTKIILFPQGIPYPFWTNGTIMNDIATRHKEIVRTVFYHELHKNAWEYKEPCTLIPPSLDFDAYPQWTGKEKRIVTVGSNVENIDWAFGTAIWQRVTSNLPAALVGENNEGFGSSDRGIIGILEHSQLIEYMQSSLVYLNPVLHLPVSYAFLEALAIGMPVVSCINPLTMLVLNNYNGDSFGYFTPIVHQMRLLLQEIISLDKDDFYKRVIDSGMSERAKNVVRLFFNEEQFSTLWNKLFEEIL